MTRAPGEREVFLREIDLGLYAPGPGRDVVPRHHVGKTEPREDDVPVVEIRDVTLRYVPAVDAEIHDDARGARKPPRGVLYLPRRTVDQGNQFREGERRDEAVVRDALSVPEPQRPPGGVEPGEIMSRPYVEAAMNRFRKEANPPWADIGIP